MNTCMLCGKETLGSIGAAGIKWTKICQPCKDEEDNYLKDKMVNEGAMLEKVLHAIYEK